MRVNLGCGSAYMEGWVNVDPSPDVRADIYLDAAEFVRQYGDEVEEVYLGHVLEHLMPGEAIVALRLLNERLSPGAVVSAVVPDMAAIFAAYRDGAISNDELNASYVYSYVQPSHHLWCYDPESLAELFRRAGFEDVEPVDPTTWPPVYWKTGEDARWQCGVKAPARGAPGAVPAEVGEVFVPSATEATAGADGPTVTAEALLLDRVRRLREQLHREVSRRSELERTVAGEAPVPAAPSGAPPPAPAPAPAADASGQPVAVRRSSRALVRTTAQRLLPRGSRSRAVARASLLTFRETRRFGQRVRETWLAPGVVSLGEPSYERWHRAHDATADALRLQRTESARASAPASVLVAVLGGSPAEIEASLRSVAPQSWQHWEAAVCAPGQVAGLAPDGRTRVVTAPSGTVVDATNQAVIDTSADFVVLLDAGDRLTPDCLYHVAAVAHQDPLVDLVGWDDDRLTQGGRRVDPRFRPSWSPELLLSANYLGHSFALRRRRYLYAGGLRDGYGEAAAWDLLLRSGLDEERVARVPRVLSSVHRRPEGVDEAGVRAVRSFLEAARMPATAELAGSGVRLSWRPASQPHVTVIIPTRHNRPMLSRCLPTLKRTDYPSFDVFVVDNGGHTADNERWYAETFPGLELQVEWWDRPFNYSAVNNAAGGQAKGEVLVFLNDDTEVLDPGWLRELVGWTSRPDVGVVGMQLLGPDDRLQHAGAVLGLNGFADHVFEGMPPGSSSLLGPTDRYRNVLAVTGACLAVRRELFESLGGFDERFVLCGSDVALGLDARLAGLRNVCSPLVGVRHLESATRGSSVPTEDFFASYWRYNPWIFGGDPYFSPNLSLVSRRPRLRSSTEPTPAQQISGPLGREFQVFRQRNDAAESRMLADACRARPSDVEAVRQLHARNREPFEVATVNWYIPDIDSPFYGGINTALRIADHLTRSCGVENRFVVWGAGPDYFVRSAVTAAFPSLASAPISFYDDASGVGLDSVPAADVSVATLWVTAYALAQVSNTRRKFYLIQDFEPMFYPASTLYALAEETYRLGLYGLCNTDNLARIYRQDYGGSARSFTPAVDPSVFHGRDRVERTPDAPVTVFVYARPGHWRNCWELASLALEELKERLGDRVRIVTAGSWAVPAGEASGIKHLGLLDYRATGALYRRCDVGLALTVSKHPSYLPLELMACGVPVVAFDNPWGHWILRDEENCLLAKRTVDDLVDKLDRLASDAELRRRLSGRALADIAAGHGSWERALAGIYPYLCDPEGGARSS